MSNNAFIIGLEKIASYADLTKDIQRKLKEAKTKVANKWIKTYAEKLPSFGRSMP